MAPLREVIVDWRWLLVFGGLWALSRKASRKNATVSVAPVVTEEHVAAAKLEADPNHRWFEDALLMRSGATLN